MIIQVAVLAQITTARILANAIADPSPSDDFPGADVVTAMLGWLKWLGLSGSLAALLIGGAVWGLSHQGGNTVAASKGRQYALGGATGAIVVGLGSTIVNTLSGLS